MKVYKETHYGVEVVVSPIAEEGKKGGCLCVHKEKRNTYCLTVKCNHLVCNDRYKDKLRTKIMAKHPGLDNEHVEQILKGKLAIRAVHGFREITQRGGMRIAPDGVCIPALILYSLCVSAKQAMAMARCPDYDYDQEADRAPDHQ